MNLYFMYNQTVFGAKKVELLRATSAPLDKRVTEMGLAPLRSHPTTFSMHGWAAITNPRGRIWAPSKASVHVQLKFFS